MDSLYKLQADVCKIFANDKRLEIINLLKHGEMSNSDLMKETRLSKANISQHMHILKSKGVITTRKEGQHLFYSIANPKIIQACTLMREVLIEQHMARQQVVSRLVKESGDTAKKKSVKNPKSASNK